MSKSQRKRFIQRVGTFKLHALGGPRGFSSRGRETRQEFNIFRKKVGHRVQSEFFRQTGKHYREVQKQFDAEIFQKGLYAHFARNPIGTSIGLCLIFLTIFYLGSGVGPITNATIANDFTILYNNTAGWLGPLVFFAIFIPSMALAVFMPRREVQPVVMVKPEEVEESQESST